MRRDEHSRHRHMLRLQGILRGGKVTLMAILHQCETLCFPSQFSLTLTFAFCVFFPVCLRAAIWRQPVMELRRAIPNACPAGLRAMRGPTCKAHAMGPKLSTRHPAPRAGVLKPNTLPFFPPTPPPSRSLTNSLAPDHTLYLSPPRPSLQKAVISVTVPKAPFPISESVVNCHCKQDAVHTRQLSPRHVRRPIDHGPGHVLTVPHHVPAPHVPQRHV